MGQFSLSLTAHSVKIFRDTEEKGQVLIAELDRSSGVGSLIARSLPYWSDEEVTAFLLGWFHYSVGGVVNFSPEGMTMFTPLEFSVTALDIPLTAKETCDGYEGSF